MNSAPPTQAESGKPDIQASRKRSYTPEVTSSRT
jgi:hypothetical protein